MASANPNQTIAQLDNDDEDESDETTTFLQTASSTPASVTIPATMASEDHHKRHKEKKDKRAAEPSSIFYQHMTTATHACLLLYVILIIYLCFADEFVFFTWHPLLLSIGWMFLMTEAVLMLSKDNLFTGTLPKKLRVRLHWIFLIISLVLVLGGFAVAYINKNNLNKSHFKSWHAIFGLTGIVCSIPTSLDGILALYHGDLRHYIHPRYSKFIHFATGVLTLAFGGAALILSVYTKWFARHSGENILTFLLGLAFTVVAVSWTLVRPMGSALKLLKKFVKKSED